MSKECYQAITNGQRISQCVLVEYNGLKYIKYVEMDTEKGGESFSTPSFPRV